MTLEQHGGWGTDTHTVENLPVTYSQPFVSIHSSSASTDSANHGSRSTVVFTIEKNPHISGPVQSKPVLFKGQL